MSWPRAFSATRCAGCGSLSTNRSTHLVGVRDIARAALSHVDLEPHAGPVLVLHAPPVGDLFDEVETPAGILVLGGEGLAGVEPRTAVRHLDPKDVTVHVAAQPDPLAGLQAGVAHAVRDELGHEEPDLVQSFLVHVAGELVERVSGLPRRLRPDREPEVKHRHRALRRPPATPRTRGGCRAA